MFRNESGNITVMFALLSPVLCLAAALAIDIETFYLQKRALQGATDIAAVAAAQNPTQALAAAQENLVLNGFPSSAVQSVQLGNYVADPTLPPAQRFVPAANGLAAQVKSQIQAPFYFATILNLWTPLSSACTSNCGASNSGGNSASATISASATAVWDSEASFAVGSGLVSLNNGVANAILGSLLGANLSLYAMDYNALASTNIDLFQFSNALATRIGATADNYNQLANTQVATPVFFAALADAVNATSGAPPYLAGELSQLANLAPNTTIALGQLMSFGEYGSLQAGATGPITAKTDVLDMVTAIAQLANGNHQAQTALNLSISPVASASVQMTVGERPIGSGYFSIGSTGVNVHTAQTRLLITLQIGQVGSSSLINLPIYIEIASATASLSPISCSTNPTQDSVTLAVTPGVVNAWIGSVSSADMSNFSSEPSPAPAALVNVLGVGQVYGRANASVMNLSPVSQTFYYSDIQNEVRKSTSTADYVSSLLNNLFANLSLTLSVGGVQVSVPPLVSASIASTLATATSPIDEILSQVLQTLGLSVGNAYTWVSGVKCGPSKLVL